MYKICEDEQKKLFRSKSYNFNFDKRTGFFARWGETEEDDPEFSPYGPEIMDLEISVDGCPNNCPFCYKGNSNKEATNMTFDTFKQIVDKMPPTLTQIAFGITGIQTNPDFIKMMEYCREIGIIPNFTLSGIDLTQELAEKVAGLVGALAVSAYESDKNVCYNTVQTFTSLGIDQTNIHLMVSKETMPFVMEVLENRLTDPRLKDMNAIVFLGVKPKGRAKGQYHPISAKEYEILVKFCMENNIAFGFDSCSAPKFEHAVKNGDFPEDVKKNLIMCSESCESSLFSAYINVAGEYWHCSFAEGEEPAYVDVLAAEDFVRDVWYSEPVKEFRKRSLGSVIEGCRMCTVFPEINP